MINNRKRSISTKIFSITLTFILIVFLITFFFLMIFFEDFYMYEKTKDLTTKTKRFTTLYNYENSDTFTDTLSTALSYYEEANSTRMAIFKLDGSGEVILSNNFNFTTDNSLMTAFCYELLNDTKLINSVVANNEIQSTIFTNKSSDSKKIGIVAPMSVYRKNDAVLITVSSVQPIKEAAAVIKSFCFYLLLGILVVSALLTKFYTKLIVKPLIKINNSAVKMSNLDFSVKCEVVSDDEIGSLANSLNFLSQNLKSALDDLTDKNNQLKEDIEKERHLETMRKDFVASVSHDLKTPIGIISGYAEGLRDGVVPDDNVGYYLDSIIDESKKMNSLVNSMLQLSNLESNSTILNLETFNIVRLIHAMVKKLSLDLNEKHLKVNYDGPEYAYVTGDILKIEQVMQNLITNAIKYSPNQNTIFVRIFEENNCYNISVENTGAHIPEKELSNIFIKFYRVDKSGNRSTNSFGLGLAIVKKILELHHSEFGVKNTQNGVLFYFTLRKENLDDLE